MWFLSASDVQDDQSPKAAQSVQRVLCLCVFVRVTFVTSSPPVTRLSNRQFSFTASLSFVLTLCVLCVCLSACLRVCVSACLYAMPVCLFVCVIEATSSHAVARLDSRQSSLPSSLLYIHNPMRSSYMPQRIQGSQWMVSPLGFPYYVYQGHFPPPQNPQPRRIRAEGLLRLSTAHGLRASTVYGLSSVLLLSRSTTPHRNSHSRRARLDDEVHSLQHLCHNRGVIIDPCFGTGLVAPTLYDGLTSYVSQRSIRKCFLHHESQHTAQSTCL